MFRTNFQVMFLYPHPTPLQSDFWTEVGKGLHVERPLHMERQVQQAGDFRLVQQAVREAGQPAPALGPEADGDILEQMSVHSSASTEY